MRNQLRKRLLITIPILLFVTLFNFILISLAPGDPVDAFFNPNATAADLEAKRASLGLDKPMIYQYFVWLGNVLHGDFGYSYSSYEPVTKILSYRIGPTLLLMGISMLVAYIIAIPIGIISATKQYSALDHTVTGLSFIGISVPSFFFGLFGIFIFSLNLHWLPTGGMYSLGKAADFGDRVKHLILPVAVLSLSISGKMVRYVRSSMLDVLNQDYLRTARAKGLKEVIVIGRHALKNALIPIITVIGLDIPLLIGGAVVTEQIFQWPGIGQLTIQSINSRDYPVLMAINLLSALFVVASNLLTDLAYRIVDPRIKE
ncbi:MAG: ABC transporter permease [Spirochaetales bacterium]|nr:ABC transporter permease [Spirochaetales bacterium]